MAAYGSICTVRRCVHFLLKLFLKEKLSKPSNIFDINFICTNIFYQKLYTTKKPLMYYILLQLYY